VKINSDPGLEILTDDVRCSHGVTITEIDTNELFYMNSRGISEQDGQRLIVQGFISEVISRVNKEEIKKYIKNKLYIAD
jgi:Fe-S cluster assembly protein SufD